MSLEEKLRVFGPKGCLPLNHIDGLCYPPLTTGAHLAKIGNMEIRDDDIWIASYPKTGTHWTWEIVNMMRQQTADVSKLSFGILEFAVPDDQLEIAEKAPSPRVIVSHLPPDKLPQQLFTSKAKIIYNYRNPKDALLSFYHMHKIDSGVVADAQFTGDLEDWIQIYVQNQDKQMYRGLVDHVHGWMEKAEEFPGKVHPIVYEDLKKDPAKGVQGIAEFLDLPLPRELRSEIVDKTHFAKMVKVKLNGEMKGFLHKHQNMFYRKGEVGGWKAELTVAQNDAVDEVLKSNPHYSSLRFVYSI